MPTQEVEVREKPILMSSEMVRAILEGRKTQTRRVAREPIEVELLQTVRSDFPLEHEYCFAKSGLHKAQLNPLGAVSVISANGELLGVKPGEFRFVCPYGQPGDRLWVREAFAMECDCDGNAPPFSGRPVKRESFGEDGDSWSQPHYRATDEIPDLSCEHDKCEGGPCTHPWQPSIHMPRWASRLTLEITKIRVERLHTITCADAIAEGIDLPDSAAKQGYRELWDKINAKRGFGWDSNPWVWVVEFRRVA